MMSVWCVKSSHGEAFFQCMQSLRKTWLYRNSCINIKLQITLVLISVLMFGCLRIVPLFSSSTLLSFLSCFLRQVLNISLRLAFSSSVHFHAHLWPTNLSKKLLQHWFFFILIWHRFVSNPLINITQCDYKWDESLIF